MFHHAGQHALWAVSRRRFDLTPYLVRLWLSMQEERQTVVENACPGPGACGGMYTANTMASAIEVKHKHRNTKARWMSADDCSTCCFPHHCGEECVDWPCSSCGGVGFQDADLFVVAFFKSFRAIWGRGGVFGLGSWLVPSLLPVS